jgi:hypothetical protein
MEIAAVLESWFSQNCGMCVLLMGTGEDILVQAGAV